MSTPRWFVPAVAVLALCGAAGPGDPASDPQPAGDPAAGARWAGLGGCAACHTAEGGPAYGGGHVLDTPWGTFVGPNLSSDPVHGLGAWTFDDFRRAMRDGRAPDGRPYYPSFPYPSFTAMTDDDLADLWAFLRTVPPVDTPDAPHDIPARFRGRVRLNLWRMLAFRRGPFEAERDEDPEIARGRYLAEAIGHCGDCHTPRDTIGRPRRRHAFAGTDAPPEPSPNITPHADGLAGWTEGDVDTLLSFGMFPDGDFVGGEMLRVVQEGTAPLSASDRAAIGRWLLSLPGRPDPQ